PVHGYAGARALLGAAELEGQQRDHSRDGRDHEHTGDRRRRRPHTRRTCFRPKSPFGFRSSTVSSTANAIGSRSSAVAKPRYWPTRFRKTPSTSPPTTAPAGLSSPPRTAAANAYSRIACIIVGWRKVVGSVISPATAPSTAARPQPIASIQLTRTPTREAAVGRSAAR